MKTLRISSIITLFMVLASFSFAQKVKTETLKVSGECGSCKKKIEKAAKEAGATYAVWSTETKVLTIRYNSLSTNSAKIQKKIAGVGYDTPDFKASDEAYDKLDACCQYDREAVDQDMKCCSEKCEMKDGKCADEAACEEKGCCKDSEKCKAMGCCGNEMTANNAKMDCCKKGSDGKMAMNCGDSKKAMSCGDSKTSISCCDDNKKSNIKKVKQ